MSAQLLLIQSTDYRNAALLKWSKDASHFIATRAFGFTVWAIVMVIAFGIYAAHCAYESGQIVGQGYYSSVSQVSESVLKEMESEKRTLSFFNPIALFATASYASVSADPEPLIINDPLIAKFAALEVQSLQETLRDHTDLYQNARLARLDRISYLDAVKRDQQNPTVMLESMSLEELRGLGKQNKIRNWHRLGQPKLIARLAEIYTA